jgi:type II secretory pathway pseudopilin PulG
VIILAIVGILGAIGMSAMNDRVVKERVVEAFRTGESAARLSQAFYVKNGRWPTQAEFSRQSFDTTSSTRGPVAVRGIQSISIADDGTITIAMTGHAELNDKLIRLKPTALQQDVSWKCASDYEQRGFPEFFRRRCNDRFPRE